MATLSVIIPTFNEEAFIENAIKSVSFADEIILVDSFSTDGTAAIAKQHNCTVLQRTFANFSDQKNYAIKFVKSDWILFLDADERITFRLQKAILKAIKSDKYDAYKLIFPHFFMNRFLYKHYDKVLRLVKKSDFKFEGKVHEKMLVKGKIGILKPPVLHFTYKGLKHYINKKDSYAWFQAEQLLKKGKKATCFNLIFKPMFRFIKSYVIRKGFLDGIPGLAVAAINAYGVFSRYAKLLLLQKGLK